MSNAEQKESNAVQVLSDLKKIRELIRHVKNVQHACVRMGEYMIENGESEFGRSLIANSFIHDQSKFRGVEWEAIGCRDSDHKESIPAAILNHVKSNPHHPEYWGGIAKMPEIYIAEMVADWWARSTEMGTDFRQWVTETAPERYGFTMQQKVGKTIKKYMSIILAQPFN